MISNTKQHSASPWQCQMSLSPRQNPNHNIFDEYFNDTPSKDIVNESNFNYKVEHESAEFNQAQSNLEEVINSKNVADSVLFERIVPQTVKRMWVKAADPSIDYNINIEHNIHQNMLRYSNQHQKLDKRISHEIGDVFISHDIVKEEKRKEKIKQQKKNESIVDSSELPVARSKWGINLRHVPIKESKNEDHLPYGFPRLRRLSSGEKQRPNSVSEQSFKQNEFTNIRRAKSTEILNNNDTTDNCVVDIEKLNNNVTEEESPKLSVLERMKNFQNNSYKPQDFDKYAHFRTSRSKSPLNSNAPMFFQGEKSTSYPDPVIKKNSSVSNHENNRMRRRSLVDLLKKDELSLSVDVVDKRIQENSIAKHKEKNIPNDEHNIVIASPKNKESAVTDHTSHHEVELKTNESKNDSVFENSVHNSSSSVIASPKNKTQVDHFTNNQVELKPSIHESKKNHSSFANGVHNFNSNKADSAIHHQTKSKKNLQTQTPSVKPAKSKPNDESSKENFLPGKEFDTPLYNADTPSPQQKAKIVRKIFASAPVNNNNNNNHIQNSSKASPKASPKTEYHFKVDKKIDPQPQQSSGNPNIKYNKLGQVVLTNLEPQEPQEIHKLEEVENSTSKPTSPVPVPQSAKHGQPEQPVDREKRKIGNHSEKGARHNSFDISVSTSGNKISASKSTAEDAKINQPKMVSVPRQQVLPKAVPSTTNHQTQPLPSLSQQKRRVGKLIIMTGDQRDEQLRNKSSNKNSAVGGVRQVSLKREVVENPKNPIQGLALTFMSNELDELDEDPNLPPPKVPKIIFNSPVESVKSIMSSGVNKNKNRKAAKVAFSTKNLATIYSYPAESSYYYDELADEGNPNSSAPPSGLSGYQPSSVNDLGTVIQRERDRLNFSTSPNKEASSPPPVIQYSTEGDHFNTHNNQEGGHALLF